MAEQTNSVPPENRWLARGSFLGSILAFIGASCCVLPILLVNLGVSTALVGRLAFFARYKDWFLGLSLLAILLALGFAFRNGRKPTRRLMIWLGVSTLLIAIAYTLPHYEGQILRWILQK
jgi:mercuric ion transport protein